MDLPCSNLLALIKDIIAAKTGVEADVPLTYIGLPFTIISYPCARREISGYPLPLRLNPAAGFDFDR